MSIEVLGSVGLPAAPFPLLSIRIPSADNGGVPRRVVITAGIHGDEPAGVEAVTRLIETPQEWSPRLAPFDVTIFPCLNPTGFSCNSRTNGAGIDLNRTFDQADPPLETGLIKTRLAANGRHPAFDAAIEFHEDSDGQGFYLYELATALPHIGDDVVAAVAPLVTIDPRSLIEGLPAKGGVIRPDPAGLRDTLPGQWPQALYSAHTGIPSCLTLETPSTLLPIDRRAEIHLVALTAALAHRWRP